jgi:hypothetical protein
MHEHEIASALIDRVVAGAHIASHAERESLRRELWTHFEDAAASPDGIANALARFGQEVEVTESFRRVYRWDYYVLYLAKIAASVVASVAMALVIEVLVNLRLELEAEVWRLAPGFSHAAVFAVAVVLALVTAWEAGRQPFNGRRAVAAIGAYAAVTAIVAFLFTDGLGAVGGATFLVAVGCLCSRLDVSWQSRPAKLLLTFCVFAACLYATHSMVSVAFGPSRALATSGVLVAVWASTVVILTRVDHVFVNLFNTTGG